MGRRPTTQAQPQPQQPAEQARVLRLFAGAAQRGPGVARARRGLRGLGVALLRLEDQEQHGLAFFQLEAARWMSRGTQGPPARTARTAAPQTGRLKTAAPQALTATPAAASAQKARLASRRPNDSNTIK